MHTVPNSDYHYKNVHGVGGVGEQTNLDLLLGPSCHGAGMCLMKAPDLPPSPCPLLRKAHYENNLN